MLMIPKSEAEIFNSLKVPLDTKGNGRFAPDSQGLKQTSGSDPRTRTFHKRWVTVGDTACSVKGVLHIDFNVHLVHLDL